MNYAQQLLRTLDTTAKRQEYENTHGGGSFAQLLKDAGPEATLPSNTLKRDAFDAMSPSEKMAFAKNGGEVV